MHINKNKKDLTYLSWTKTRDSSGTAGSYLKSYELIDGKKVYYKLSLFDDINDCFGYESFNEIIAANICSILGFNHLEYYLQYASIIIKNKEYDTYLNYSYDFKERNESKITLEVFYELNKKDNEDIFSFCSRYNFIDDIYNMLILDYLIFNRDRHGANIEVLYNNKTKKYRLAPIFDNGLSLLSPNYLQNDIDKFDIEENKRVNNYIGSSDPEYNIRLVPKDKLKQVKFDVDDVFEGLDDILNPIYLKKAKMMIERRLERLENISIEG